MPMISGRIIEVENWNHTFEVDKRETFHDVLQRKPAPADNEAISRVEDYQAIWTSVARGRERFGQNDRFTLVVRLPRVSDVEKALIGDFHCTSQLDFGEIPPRNETYWWREYPLLLEKMARSNSVRVIALGRNDINSCHVFELTDLNEYRQSISAALEQAASPEEVNCWQYLLQ